MIQIRAIDHVVLRVVDVQSMIAFYTNVLGCSVRRREEALGLHQLQAGSSLIDLVQVDSPLGHAGGAAPGHEGRNMDHLCLRIEAFNEAALRVHLRNAGVEAGPVEHDRAKGGACSRGSKAG